MSTRIPLKVAATSILAGAAMLLTACASGTGSQSGLTGTWGDPEASSTPSLTFEAPSTEAAEENAPDFTTEADSIGRVSGTDGCNSMGGIYGLDGTAIDFSGFVSTMMYCDGVDTWLSQARSGRIDGDTITFFDESGDEIGTLDRHGK